MSTERADQLIEATAEADVLSEAVESHLDARPLPVDEAQVQRIADRLHKRLHPPASSRWPLVISLMAAALSLFAVWNAQTTEHVAVVAPTKTEVARANVPQPITSVPRQDVPESVNFAAAHRTVIVAPDSTLLSVEVGPVAVVLVQAGQAETLAQVIAEFHWAVITTLPDQSTPTVIFADGTAPPEDLQTTVHAGPELDATLRQMRWNTLPEETLNLLDQLLEIQ